MNLKSRIFTVGLIFCPLLYINKDLNKTTHVSEDWVEVVRYDHINCSMRLPGHGKNTASSVIVFPQIIFLGIEKHILEV